MARTNQVNIDGRQVLVPEVVTSQELVRISGNNPNHRTLAVQEQSGRMQEIPQNRRIQTKNGESFHTILNSRGGQKN